MAAPVGDYPSSIHLLRDTHVAAGPKLVVVFGNVALRTTAASITLNDEAGSALRLPTLNRLRALGFERGRAIAWPEPLEPGAAFLEAWRDAWDDAPLPHLLWLSHPSAQNMSPEREGAFTGEVSGSMIKEAGAEYVIIGHSERRTLFGETDAGVNRKTIAAIAIGLTPIVCIGETLDQRERNETLEVLDRQIKTGFDGLTGEQVAALVVAYEPVWAIGTGRTATPAQAGEAHAHIRSRLRQWFGGDAADQCIVLYGGSVKPDNIRDLMAQPDVDGALVGGASLDVRVFYDIIARSRPGAA